MWSATVPISTAPAQTVSVHLDILPEKRRAHTVSEHKIGYARILFLRPLPKRMHVPEHTRVSILFIKETHTRFCLYGFTVPEMIISHDIIAFPRTRTAQTRHIV